MRTPSLVLSLLLVVGVVVLIVVLATKKESFSSNIPPKPTPYRPDKLCRQYFESRINSMRRGYENKLQTSNRDLQQCNINLVNTRDENIVLSSENRRLNSEVQFLIDAENNLGTQLRNVTERITQCSNELRRCNETVSIAYIQSASVNVEEDRMTIILNGYNFGGIRQNLTDWLPYLHNSSITTAEYALLLNTRIPENYIINYTNNQIVIIITGLQNYSQPLYVKLVNYDQTMESNIMQLL